MRPLLILVAATSIAAASASRAEDYRVGMAGAAYAPAVVEAKVGDTVVFVNDDSVEHDVFVPTIGFSTDLGSQDSGSETSLTLGKAGVFDVECVVHEDMHLRVVVTP